MIQRLRHIIRLSLGLGFTVWLSACSGAAPTNLGEYQAEGYRVIPVTPEVVQALLLQETQTPASTASTDNDGEYGPPMPTATPSQEYHYRLRAGDVLTTGFYLPETIEAKQHTAGFTGGGRWEYKASVKEDGTIAFPYAGELYVAGLTLPQVQSELLAALGKYFRNPLVAVEVTEYSRDNKIFVMGEVKKPSIQTIQAGRMNVLEAINLSEGLNPGSASYAQLYVVRGAVNIAPGSTPGTPPLDTAVYALNGTNGAGLAMAAQFPLKPNDIVYVSPTAISQWNQFMTQLIPQSVAYLMATGAWIHYRD